MTILKVLVTHVSILLCIPLSLWGAASVELSIDFGEQIATHGLHILSGAPARGTYQMGKPPADSSVWIVTEDLDLSVTDRTFLSNGYAVVDIEILYYLPSTLATTATKVHCRTGTSERESAGEVRGGLWYHAKEWKRARLEVNNAQFSSGEVNVHCEHVNDYAIRRIVVRGYSIENDIDERRMVRCTTAVAANQKLFAYARGTQAEFTYHCLNLANERIEASYSAELMERMRDDAVAWSTQGPVGLPPQSVTELTITVPTADLRFGAYDLFVSITGTTPQWNDSLLTRRRTALGVISDTHIRKAEPGEFLYGVDVCLGPPGRKDSTNTLLDWTRIMGADIMRGGFKTHFDKYPSYDVVGEIEERLPVYESYGLKNVIGYSPADPGKKYWDNELDYASLMSRKIGLVEEIAQTFPQLHYWELGNEPDIGFYKGPKEQYSIDFMKLYAGIKRGNPDAVVMNGGFVSSSESERYDNMVTIIDGIDADSIDGWAYHGHGPLKNEKSSYNRLAAVVDSLGKGGKPFFQTESGRWHHDRAGEMKQALTCPQKMIFVQSKNIPFFLWFRLLFNHPEHNDYGCLHTHDIRQPKPVVMAYRSMVELLRGYSWQDTVAFENTDLEGHLFHHPERDRYVCALWSNHRKSNGRYEIAIASSGTISHAQELDMFANPQPASLTSPGVLSADISEYPIYIRWQGDRVASVSQRKSDTPEYRLISANRITVSPLAGGLLIRCAGHGPTTIQILDCRGRTIARRTSKTEKSVFLPTGPRAEGVYVVRITSTTATIVRRFLFRDN